MTAVPESAARLSPERETEIADRAEREHLTPGPWRLEYEQCDCSDGYCHHGAYVAAVATPEPTPIAAERLARSGEDPRDYDFSRTDLGDFSAADWELMAHAREDVPALLAELAAVRAERDQARARVAALEAERHTTNEALSNAAEQLRRDRDRIAELERPTVEAKRAEIRQSYAELIAAAEETKDFEGAFDVQCRLREREEQWKREDKEPVR
ncbi:hypothetical protein [Streptomyces mutabilis]|uniref:hypothetical protein n=1 Tax=Streptomyces mutabilis TaxID=67332 RepID=UPI0036C22E20